MPTKFLRNVPPLKPSLLKMANPHSLFPIRNSRRCGNSGYSFYFSSKPDSGLQPQLQNPGFSNLVNRVCDILSNPQIPWYRSSELISLTPKLNPSLVAEIIQIHGSTDSVLPFFFWISKRNFFKHDISCHVSMLKRLVKDKNFAPADHVKCLMIKACKDEGQIRWVVNFLNEMSIDGLSNTLYSFNTILIQLGKFGMLVEAQNVYRQLLNSGIKPSLLTLNTMINIMCKKGKVRLKLY